MAQLLLPDLVVDTPTVSDSAPVAGASFILNATVRNQGNSESSFTTLRYYQSTDSTITTADTAAGTDSVSRLEASATSPESVSITAPSTEGIYYYGACVDSVSEESDDTNNCSSAVAVTVGAAPAPDLVVDMGGGTGTTTAGTNFSVSLAVRNQGTGATSASTTLRYYRSTDAAVTDGDTEVGTDTVGPLGGSNTYSRHSIDLTAPSTKGTYHYGACVDAVPGETNDANNCSSAFTITINALGPDLVVTRVNVPTTDPIAEEDFWISIHVKNQGDSYAYSPNARFYRSIDATISSGDTEIGDARLLHMAPSQHFDSGSIKELTTAPSTAGTYYYGACMDSLEGESDTTNNCSSAEAVTVYSASGSDLVIESFWIPAIEFYFPLLPLYATVHNQGTGPAASTPVIFYLSTDATITTSDTRIDGQYVKRLAPSETSGYGSVQVTTTAETIPGTYYYGACVQPVSGETDTTNNCSDAVAVTVGDVATASGAPTGLTATADGQTEIDLSWTAPSDGGGATITGYKIEVSTNGSSWRDLVANTGSTATSYSHTGLTAGATRHYRISAINSAGAGPASNTDSATTAAAPASKPGAPTGLTATADGQTEIDLSWTAPSDDGGAAITGYRIEVSTNGSSWRDLVADTDSASTIYTHTGLTAGATRHYRVSAINSAGTGPASGTDSATTDSPPAATAPGAPTSLSATADGQTEIDLSWTSGTDSATTDATGG